MINKVFKSLYRDFTHELVRDNIPDERARKKEH